MFNSELNTHQMTIFLLTNTAYFIQIPTKMKKIITLLFSLLFSLIVIAQENSKILFPDGMLFSTKKEPLTGPEGSIYLYEDWKNATLHTNKNDTISGVSVKVNLFHHQTVIQDENEEKAVEHTYLNYIEIENRKLYSSSNWVMEKRTDGLFEFIYESANCKIAKLLYVQHMKPNYNIQSNSGSKVDIYTLKDESYLIIEDKAFKIPVSTKSFAALFGEKENDISQFIKKEKLKIKKVNDLIKIVNFYETVK